MSTTQTRVEGTAKFKVPWDITEWLDKAELLDCLVQNVDSLDWQNPELAELLRSQPNWQPRLLLLLIGYAYAMGICESDEVGEVYYRDAAFRSRVGGHPPSPAAITRFRRDYRALIKWELIQAFKHALRRHYQLGDTAIPPGVLRALTDAAMTRIDVARHLDRSVQVE